MANEVLFINEEFYKRHISSTRGIDDAQIVSTVRLVQNTNLKELISEPVYDQLQSVFAENADFTAGEERLFAHIQLYLAVTCAYEMTMASPTRDDTIREESPKVYQDKSHMLEGMIVRDINADPTLLALAQTGTVETWIDEDEPSLGGFFYV